MSTAQTLNDPTGVTHVSAPGSATPSKSGKVHSIGIAGMKIARVPDTVRTVLGSCIGIALYDRVAKIGGLGHVILPNSKEGSGDPKKFADTAVDILLEDLVAAGASRKRIVAKIAGGAAMFGGGNAESLGRRNAEAVEARLTHHAIRLAAKAVGGTKGRKMCLYPATGKVMIERIGEACEEI